jgi:predicted nucleic acid-binding protein
MAVSPVLADSSFYITTMRQKQDPLKALAAAGATRDLAICGVVRCEVGRALKHENTRKRFQQIWDVMINVPTDNRLWAQVEQLLWTLDRDGITVSLTDAVIACCAIRIDAIVLTYDADFWRIPGVRVTQHLDY